MALTERQNKQTWYWTNGCFRRALLDQYDAVLSPKEKRYSLPKLKELLVAHDWPIHSPEINDRYKKNLLGMPTDRLELILQSAQAHRRKQETIDAITTELFERSVNPESKDQHADQS